MVLKSLCKRGSRTKAVVDACGLVVRFCSALVAAEDVFHYASIGFVNGQSWATGVVRLYRDTTADERVAATQHRRAYHEALRAAPLANLHGSDLFSQLGVSTLVQWFGDFNLLRPWSLRLYEVVGGSRKPQEFLPAEVEIRWFGEEIEFWNPSDAAIAGGVGGALPPVLDAPLGDEEAVEEHAIVPGDPAAPEAPLEWAVAADVAVQYWSAHED